MMPRARLEGRHAITAQPVAGRKTDRSGTMLTSIRRHARSWVVKVLFGLLIFAFGAWGIGDVFRGAKAPDPILRIGKEYEYTAADFQRELKLSLQRVSQLQGMQVTPEMFHAVGGTTRLVDQAESKGLLEAYARRLGIEIPQATAIQVIEQNPDFANAAGAFDRDRFSYFLRQSGIGEAEYVETMRAQMRANQVLAAITAAIQPPAPATRAIFQYRDEMRTAEVLVLPRSSITEAGTPDEAALKKWHEDHAADYQAPELRAATLLQMVPSDFIAEVAVSDDEIQQEYEARKADFTTPETREVEQVVVQDQAKADEIAAAARSGKPFAEAVTEATGGKPVSLGQVTREKLPADIADKVFALTAGSVSESIKSPFGFHVVHVISVAPGNTKALEDVKGEVRNSLALGRATDAMESVREQLQDELAGGASLEDAAAKLKLRLEKIEAVDASGKDAVGADRGIGADAVSLIFMTEAGEPSVITSLDDGSYAVVQVTGVTPPALKALNSIRTEVSADWLAARQFDLAKAKAEAIREKLKTGGDLAAEASALGLPLKVTRSFKRSEGDSENGVDAALTKAIFQLKSGEMAITDGAEGPIIARLTGIVPATPENAADDLKSVSELTGRSLAGDIQQQFLAALKDEIPVERNDAEWQRMIGQPAQ